MQHLDAVQANIQERVPQLLAELQENCNAATALEVYTFLARALHPDAPAPAAPAAVDAIHCWVMWINYVAQPLQRRYESLGSSLRTYPALLDVLLCAMTLTETEVLGPDTIVDKLLIGAETNPAFALQPLPYLRVAYSFSKLRYEKTNVDNPQEEFPCLSKLVKRLAAPQSDERDEFVIWCRERRESNVKILWKRAMERLELERRELERLSRKRDRAAAGL